MSGFNGMCQSMAVACAIGAVIYFTFIGVKHAEGDVSGSAVVVSESLR